MLRLSQLYIYPIKSLGGISLDEAEVMERGLAGDRRYLLVDPNGKFITIRRYPKMWLLQPTLTEAGLTVNDRSGTLNPLSFHQPASDAPASLLVEVWGATMLAQPISAEADDWFSRALGTPCALVYMPDSTRRTVTPSSGLRPAGKITSFADAYPMLMIGEASLTDLNARLTGNAHINMLRFRPNLVFSGGEPYVEDGLGRFSINGIKFNGLEPCARCNVPNVIPETGEIDPTFEPLRTLNAYRKEDGKINFGVNLVHEGVGRIRVGDPIQTTIE